MAFMPNIVSSFRSWAFLYGLGAGLSVYAILAAWALIGGAVGLESVQGKLASQTITITRSDAVVSHSRKDSHQPRADHQDQPLQEAQSTTNSTVRDHDQLAKNAPQQDQGVPDVAMKEAPYPGLYETDAKGSLLPIIRDSDGLTPFQAYKRPFVFKEGQKMIALVLDGFGLSNELSKNAALLLPENVSFIMSPYTRDSKALAQTARNNGHEIWLKIPFENQNFPYEDPGSKAILSRASLSANMDNLKWALASTSGYVGLAFYSDLAFQKSKPALNALFKEAIDRGLGLFETNISAPSQIKDIASRFNAPYIKNEITFFDGKWNNNIDEAAELLETIAESRGRGVGVFKAYPDALNFINRWAPQLEQKGFTLVPLSAIYLADNKAKAARTMPSANMAQNKTSTHNSNKKNHDDGGQH
ncbi:MAG: hypothetical protein CMH27_01315 [Micavibrio sp.]|nr:hypothetical protein [Micavibrio sp.]|tara:strand:+ start:1294 stop:2541 length:1248 start_codon:yes stop_codon:yes gene_type:complete